MSLFDFRFPIELFSNALRSYLHSYFLTRSSADAWNIGKSDDNLLPVLSSMLYSINGIHFKHKLSTGFLSLKSLRKSSLTDTLTKLDILRTRVRPYTSEMSKIVAAKVPKICGTHWLLYVELTRTGTVIFHNVNLIILVIFEAKSFFIMHAL